MTKEQIVAIITSPSGASVDMFTILSVGRLEDGQYSVTYDEGEGPRHLDFQHEKLFDDADKAAEFFLAERTRLELGYDFDGTDA